MRRSVNVPSVAMAAKWCKSEVTLALCNDEKTIISRHAKRALGSVLAKEAKVTGQPAESN